MQKLKKYLFICLLTIISTFSFAQYKVTFFVKWPLSQHPKDQVYIAGSFNSWEPAGSRLISDKTAQGEITLSLPAGEYEYKFTRGGWEKVETDSSGKDIQNRKIKVKSDTTINNRISGWKDDFKNIPASTEKNSTASVNVKIMDTSFYMPQLKRYRRIWLYLPPDYASSKKKYPVLYMQDGQNLFDNATSFAGEWGVDEYLDSIYKKGQKEVIVVGIDNGNLKRMQEYNPWEYENYGKGEGDKYVDFLVTTLKPYIDTHYRTLKGKPNTFIAGSSMGGLISLYAVLKYPRVYGGAGIFSPSFQTASGIDSSVVADSKKMNSKLFFYAGGKEDNSMVPDMKRIEKEIRKRSASPIKEMIDPDANHNEEAWKKYFPDFFVWAVEGK